MKKLALYVLSFIFLLCVTVGFVGCTTHEHSFTEQVTTEQYLASAATCTEAARYYYSCTCGEKGTQTFASGNALGHSYSADWSHNQTEHWHAATCGHNVEKDRATHSFDSNKKCTVCNYTTVKPLGVELQSTVFEINSKNKTAYLKVANAVADYDFSDKFVVADGARFDVCTDKQCNNKITSKRTDLIAGDNVFYILVTNGNNVASYTVTLRRRPIYTISFNTVGGSKVEAQQIEEGGFATAPTTTRKGYEFTAWDYDFSSPVLQEEVVTASWQIIVYNITYDLNVPADSVSQVVDNSFNPTTYTVEDEITFAALSRVGYTFTGWDKGIAKGTTETQTITASWQIIAYNISYQLNGGEVVGGNPTNYTVEEEKVVLSLPFMTGCTGAWNNDGKIEKGTIGDITFFAVYTPHVKLADDGSTVVGLRDTSVKDLVILSQYNGKQVTKIADNAFQGCTGLTSIVIPDSVTSIGDSAFWNCRGLTSISWNAENCTLASSSSYPFGGCTNLTTVTIGNNVKSIPSCAFYGCSGLTSVSWNAENCTSAGSYYNSIFDCTNLTTVTIGNNVKTIPSYAFRDCSGLTSVTIGSGVTSIGSFAFSGCSGLTSVTIGSGVTSIGYDAFMYCYKLVEVINNSSLSITKGSSDYGYVACYALNVKKGGSSDIVNQDGYLFYTYDSVNYLLGHVGTEAELTFPNNYNGQNYQIYKFAFYDCSSLTSITIPDSVTSIGDSAFQYCSGLASVIWNAENCTSAGSERYPIFQNCTNLTTVTIGNNVKAIPSYAFYNCSGLTSVTIPDSVASIGYRAFYNCSGLTSVTIGSGVTSIGDWAFSGCDKLENIYITDIAAWCKISGIGNLMRDASSNKKIYLNNELLTDLVIPDIVTSIGDQAFYNYSGLTSVTIGNSVTSIGDSAFRGCSGLTSVTIGSGVTSIGWGAFYCCSGLTNIKVAVGNAKYHSQENCIIETSSKTLILGCKSSVIPADGSFTSIGNSAFYGCSGLTSVTIPNSVKSIGNSAFQGCSGLTSITIPDSVTSIGSDAFYGCIGLTSVTIPDSVTSIDDGAFYGCSGLTSVTIGSGVKSIGYQAFHGCSGLTSITIGSGVKSIGRSAFYGCSGLTSITIPDSVTSIDDGAFYGCRGLTSVSWNAENCTSAGSYYNSIFDCTNLTTVAIGNNVKTIPSYAFRDCSGLTSVTIPDSVASIGYRAFYNCSGLTSVTISNSITSIGSYAFSGCYKLENIYITDIAAWCKISGIGNLMDSGSGNKKLYLSNELLTNLVIPDSVTSIGDFAFRDCSSLTSVTIGNSVTSIGSSAFEGCNGLVSITLPFVGGSRKTSSDRYQYPFGYIFGTSSYDGGVATTQYYYESTTSTTSTTYYIPSSLKSVTITDGNILRGAFYICRGLTSVTIPNSVTSIGDYAFYGCRGLTSITIPSSVKSIDDCAFV